MTDPAELSAAFNGLLDEVRAIEQKMLASDPPLDQPDILDGYRLTFSLLRVAVDTYVWGDKDNPILTDVIGPYLKWGGDNSDAFYQVAPLDPNRTYRVTGNRGDAVYMSMTVYGGPDDGSYSNRIVGTINDRTLDFDDDGNFEFTLSPDPQPGTWLKLDPDAVHALTRDYLTEPTPGGARDGRSRRSTRPRASPTAPRIWPGDSARLALGCVSRCRSCPPGSNRPTRSPSRSRYRSTLTAGRPPMPRMRWGPTTSNRTRPW